MQAPKLIYDRLKADPVFVIFLVSFITVGCVLSGTHYRYLVNPDATSYFSIAQNYAHGHIHQALSGYWSPLLSWLLVPAVWLDMNLLTTARVILTLSGAAILIILYLALARAGAGKSVRLVAAASLAPVLLKIVFGPVSPDILFALLCLIFAILAGRLLYRPDVEVAIMTGLAGTLMFFAKGFGFYLFIAVLIFAGAWQLLRVKKLDRSFLVRQTLTALAVFLVTSGIFIALISHKYHALTINQAGSFDHAAYGPRDYNSPLVLENLGPLPPPDGSAISVWADPSTLINKEPDHGWSPLASKSNFKFFVRTIVAKNVGKAAAIIYHFGPFILLGALILLWLSLQGGYRRRASLLVLISLLSVGGYSLVYIEDRYLLDVAIFSALALGLGLHAVQNRTKLPRIYFGIIAALAIASAGISVFTGIYNSIPPDKPDYLAARQLGAIIPAGSNIISDRFRSYKLCYDSRLRCYGVINPSADNQADYKTDLQNYGISYLVSYGPPKNQITANFISENFQLVGQTDQGQNLKIYKIKN
ncbi:MAG TPA: hypothetical protein VG964_02940 [Candidatus Saccharimonadales bacterium]|nr:hypothetical protein [Candidatus Saccharimonadales bacterium]